MLERLRMQEIKQIIFTLPEGVKPPSDGKIYEVGEPIMIINKPGTSNLAFVTRTREIKDAKGGIGAGTVNTGVDFVINEGSVLYAVWSYLYGDLAKNKTVECTGTELLSAEDSEITLAHIPKDVFIYRASTGEKLLIGDYALDEKKVVLAEAEDGESFKVAYNYDIQAERVSNVRQIQNNILCDVHIYIDAIDLETGDKRQVYVKIERAQLETDLVLSINDSTTSSFTPIRVKGNPTGHNLNKEIATIAVI